MSIRIVPDPKPNVPEIVDRIRLLYRRAKAAEQARIRIDLGLYAYARVFFSGWDPGGDQPSRTKAAAKAKRVVDAIRAAAKPTDEDAELYAAMAGMVIAAEASRQAFERARKDHRREAEKLAAQLPAWSAIKHVRGFSVWGLATIVGEAGDIGEYSGCRKLFKRLGLAPDECYEQGEKRTGRKIPRNSRGRVMGIIADPLFRAQWRGAKESGGECQLGAESHADLDLDTAGDAGNGCHISHASLGRVDPVPAVIPAHAIGPFGEVYIAAKTRQLAAGKTKLHADKAARRAMVKALLHDVHDGWHGRRLTYSALPKAA